MYFSGFILSLLSLHKFFTNFQLFKVMRIAIASDHGAFELKNQIHEYLKTKKDIYIIDKGVNKGNESVDYPDFASAGVKAVLNGEADRAIVFCGTGIGISIAANKYNGIRAALCHDAYTARMSRLHNNANVLAMGGRTTGIEIAKEMVDIWLSTPFEGDRHQKRLDKITEIEKNQ